MEEPAVNLLRQTIDSLEWVKRTVSHVIGGSVFLLPFAMSIAGFIWYWVILCFEAFFIFETFIYFCEMVADQRRPDGIEHTNYFTIVESCFHGSTKSIVRSFIRSLFFFDVLICTAYYFKVAGELAESFFYVEPFIEKLRPGYLACVYIAVSCFLLAFERVERCLLEHKKLPMNLSAPDVNLIKCHIDVMNVTQDTGASGVDEPKLNMNAVVKETRMYSSKRSFLLFLFTCFIFGNFVICQSLWYDRDVMIVQNATGQCPGIKQPIWWNDLDPNIFFVIPIVIFALMNYVIFLPICLEELKLPQAQYASLMNKSRITLIVIYTVLPLLVVFALGDSVPILFTTAFGYTIYGSMVTFIALAITVTSMLLRVMACCKLIQVLFFEMTSGAYYWIIVISLFFFSFLIASMSESVVYLAIIAGSVNCNLLLIIIPRLAYIQYKRERISTMNGVWMPIFPSLAMLNVIGECFSIMKAVIGILVHAVLLVTTIIALQNVDPHTRNHCREFFNQYWSS